MGITIKITQMKHPFFSCSLNIRSQNIHRNHKNWATASLDSPLAITFPLPKITRISKVSHKAQQTYNTTNEATESRYG